MPDKSGFRLDRLSTAGSTDATEASVIFVSPATSLILSPEMSADLSLATDAGVEAILLAAWARWGETMVDRLRGDFAFGIYDPMSETVFLGRDIFGIAPLYFYYDDAALVVAGTSRLVRAILGRPLARNDAFYADFIQGQFVERGGSFFEGLDRLPPAHWMKVDRRGAERYRYWSPRSVRQQSWMPDAAERFRSLFDRSVGRAAAGGDAVVLLSGGLDSSAILGSLMADGGRKAAPDCLTKTYRRTPNWVDAPYLEKLKNHFGLKPHELACDVHDPLRELEYSLGVLDGPYISYGHSVTSHLLGVARDIGHRTLLSGHGGDEVVGYGMGLLNELARKRQWLRLWREAPGMTALFGRSRVRVMRKYLSHYPRYRSLERLLQHGFPDASSDEGQSLSVQLLGKVGSSRYASRAAIDRGDHDEPMVHAEMLDNALQPLALETIGQCSRAAGVETAMPFYDRDLVELTLSLPSDWKLRHGLSRYVMRQAMAGRLPHTILMRRDKFDFTDAFVAGMIAHREKALALTKDTDGMLAGYVNGARLAAARKSLSDPLPRISGSEARFIWRCAVLAMWFSRIETTLPSPAMVPLGERLPT